MTSTRCCRDIGWLSRRGATRLERYWSLGLDRVAGLRSRPYDEQVDAVADVLEQSARLQLVSDVPLGAFLSGGVDSSILVAVMTKALGTPVKTFSVGFAEEGSALDETADAERWRGTSAPITRRRS